MRTLLLYVTKCCNTYSKDAASVLVGVRLVMSLAFAELQPESINVEFEIRSTAAESGFMIRYDTRCYFNVRLKADMSQRNLPHGNNN